MPSCIKGHPVPSAHAEAEAWRVSSDGWLLQWLRSTASSFQTNGSTQLYLAVIWICSKHKMKGVNFFFVITIFTRINKLWVNRMVTAPMIQSNTRTFNYYILSPKADLRNLSHAFVSLPLGQEKHLQETFRLRMISDNTKTNPDSFWHSSPCKAHLGLSISQTTLWAILPLVGYWLPSSPERSSRRCLPGTRLTDAPRAICGGYVSTWTHTKIASHGVGAFTRVTYPGNDAALIHVWSRGGEEDDGERLSINSFQKGFF